MKLISFLFLFLFSFSAHSEYVTLISTNNEYSKPLVIGSNETARAVMVYTVGGANGFVALEVDFGAFKVSGGLVGSVIVTNVTGPAIIRMAQTTSGCKSVVGFEIKRDSAPSQASNTVVIPEDSLGPVQIILESSTDLVNWTAASPGAYAATTSRRFFKIRAATQ